MSLVPRNNMLVGITSGPRTEHSEPGSDQKIKILTKAEFPPFLLGEEAGRARQEGVW